MVSGASNRAPAFEMSPMPERTWSASMTIWSAPSIRRIRGARSRNGVSMRVCHRSGGSKTCESDDRIRVGSIGLSFRGHCRSIGLGCLREVKVESRRETVMGKLDVKVALISGGARGQGAAEAETFSREGAKVVFGDIRDTEGQKVEARIRAGGGDVAYVHLDVTSEADWQGAVQTATGRYGKLDILVNNAAIVIPRVPIEDRTAAEWDQVMAVNAKGVFLGTKYAIPAMRRAGGGSIVNISSVAGIGQSLHQE